MRLLHRAWAFKTLLTAPKRTHAALSRRPRKPGRMQALHPGRQATAALGRKALKALSQQLRWQLRVVLGGVDLCHRRHVFVGPTWMAVCRTMQLIRLGTRASKSSSSTRVTKRSASRRSILAPGGGCAPPRHMSQTVVHRTRSKSPHLASERARWKIRGTGAGYRP